MSDKTAYIDPVAVNTPPPQERWWTPHRKLIRYGAMFVAGCWVVGAGVGTGERIGYTFATKMASPQTEPSVATGFRLSRPGELASIAFNHLREQFDNITTIAAGVGGVAFLTAVVAAAANRRMAQRKHFAAVTRPYTQPDEFQTGMTVPVNVRHEWPSVFNEPVRTGDIQVEYFATEVLSAATAAEPLTATSPIDPITVPITSA